MGKIVNCAYCRGKGQDRFNLLPCPVCGGTGQAVIPYDNTIKCPNCKGDGTRRYPDGPCPACNGIGETSPMWQNPPWRDNSYEKGKEILFLFEEDYKDLLIRKNPKSIEFLVACHVNGNIYSTGVIELGRISRKLFAWMIVTLQEPIYYKKSDNPGLDRHIWFFLEVNRETFGIVKRLLVKSHVLLELYSIENNGENITNNMIEYIKDPSVIDKDVADIVIRMRGQLVDFMR